MLTDRQLDHMRWRYTRATKGVQTGRPPQSLIDLGNALQEIDELHAQVNQLVEQLEQEG